MVLPGAQALFQELYTYVQQLYETSSSIIPILQIR